MYVIAAQGKGHGISCTKAKVMEHPIPGMGCSAAFTLNLKPNLGLETTPLAFFNIVQ